MSFLSWSMMALAAGLTIPPLIALYFLKLKRQEHPVPSTLLWKRAVEDLRVNAPFQRLRASLLLLLQLLILLAGALALGKPMFEKVERADDTAIILVDQSASMAVVEPGGQTRLERAKDQAKLCVDDLPEGARAMVIAYCDRASVVSSFDTDRGALKRKIDTIEQTQSTTSLSEALSLAEAYTENIIIGGAQAGSDIPPESPAPPATVYLFTDGRVRDAGQVTLQRFDPSKLIVTNVGERTDNVGIVTLEARRNYEEPDRLEVLVGVENFGPEPVTVEAAVLINEQNRAVQTIELAGAAPEPVEKGENADGEPAGDAADTGTLELSRRSFAVQDVFPDAGVVEVELWIDDALDADDHAWTIVDPPRHVSVLLVSTGNLFLQNVLRVLPLTFDTMTPAEYEGADEADLLDGERSRYDVVIFDGHSTARLPQGNYLFWGSVPRIEGVSIGERIDNEVLFNWDDTHPILRHVAVEGISVYEWLKLELPAESVTLIEGQTSPVLSYFTRDASQYLVCAFQLITQDDTGHPLMNTYWVTQVDFVMFMQNAIQYLASNVATQSRRGISPGTPVTLPVPDRTRTVTIHRPDGINDSVPVAGYQTVHYARTRAVGVYQADPGVAGEDTFAVNLFDAVESHVAPAAAVELGGGKISATSGELEVNEPAWPYFVLALVVILLLEWVVYNQRVFV